MGRKRLLLNEEFIKEFGDLPLDVQSIVNPDLPIERIVKLVSGEMRTREWAFIVYPDSAPADWRSILCSRFIPFAVSPLHDKDVDPNGVPKKPHYHVLISADGVKSFGQLAEIARSVNGSAMQNVDSAKGYYRYFTHLDNPEKFQYNETEITTHNGFDISKYDKPTNAERYEAIEKMQEYIDQHNITNFYVFMRLIRFTHRDWFKLCSDNCAYIITNYIKARRGYVEDVKAGLIKDDDVLSCYSAVYDTDGTLVHYVEKSPLVNAVESKLRCKNSEQCVLEF